MFTGIVQCIGDVKTIKPVQDGIEVNITCPEDLLNTLEIGDSISCDGVCSTVISITNDYFTVQYMKETLTKTTFSDLEEGSKINLEPPLTPSSKIGGHFVTGHIDETGTITSFKIQEDPQTKESFGVVAIKYSKEFDPYLIPKGSITIDGVSLTVVDIANYIFTCHLIPHTIEKTVFSIKKPGSSVNLEYDMMGKYLYKFYKLEKEA